MTETRIAGSLLALSPHRRLFIDDEGEHTANLREAFARSNAHGLIALAALRDAGAALPAEFAFWRDLARTFLGALAHLPEDGATHFEAPMPPALDATLALRIPAMRGAEYATPDLFAALWDELNELARDEAGRAGGLRKWLSAVYPALHLVGRVTLHLAENKRSADAPFAFMATYTHRLSANDKPVHLPLARALQDYAGAKNQPALRSLLAPLQTAAEQSAWMRAMLDSRRIFQPQAWSPARACPSWRRCGCCLACDWRGQPRKPTMRRSPIGAR